MPSLTDKAIIESFLKLLDERPFFPEKPLEAETFCVIMRRQTAARLCGAAPWRSVRGDTRRGPCVQNKKRSDHSATGRSSS